jgi:acyl-coenzyme A synthetase/AMP-(fatty) acid ligase
VDGTTYGQWGAVATGVAGMLGIGRGDRVLIETTRSEEPVNWLLAPLSVGASIVLCANLDPADVRTRATAEGVTKVLAGEPG